MKMLYRQHRGATLAEILTVVAVSALVLIPLIGISLQTTRLYAGTAAHVGPEEALMLALRRMESETRRARQITVTGNNTILQLTLPSKDSQGMNSIGQDAETKLLMLSSDTAHQVRYFLGVKQQVSADRQHWVAVPSTTGDTLFRAVVSDTTPLSQSFQDAPVIIAGIDSVPVIPNPQQPHQEMTTTIFSYDSATPPPLIRITLSVPVSEIRARGRSNVHHALSTQFCVRNAY